MNKVPNLSLRDKLLAANSLDELNTIWGQVELARANTMTDKTFKRCRVAFDKRSQEVPTTR
jgi:hypothetical protein